MKAKILEVAVGASSMKSRKLAMCFCVVAALACGRAEATTYYWSYTAFVGNPDLGNGTLTTDTFNNITDMSGLWDGSSITGVLPPGSKGGNDNVFFPSALPPTVAPAFDFNGVTFSVFGHDSVNLYASFDDFRNKWTYTPFFDGNTAHSNGDFIYSTNPIGPTPLPGALALFATGLGGFGLVGWRRKKKLAA